MAMQKGLLIEQAGIALANVPANYSGTASTDLWIDMAGQEHMAWLIQTGAWAGGTAAVTLLQGTSIAGAGSKALAFANYYTKTLASDAITKVAAVSNTFNLDTANKLYIVEISAASLDLVNGFGFVALDIASPGSNNDYYSVIAIGSNERYLGALQAQSLLV